MSDDVKDLVTSTEKDMQKSLEAMENDFHKYRIEFYDFHDIRDSLLKILRFS